MKWIGISALSLMMGFIFLGVVLRAFKAPILGNVEVVQILMVITIMCALPYCESKGSHIVVDILFDKFHPVAQRILTFLTKVVTMIVMVVISYVYVNAALNNHETSTLLSVSFTPLKFLIAISFFLWFLHLVGETFTKRKEA